MHFVYIHFFSHVLKMLFIIPAILQIDSHFRNTLYVRTTFACKYVLSFLALILTRLVRTYRKVQQHGANDSTNDIRLHNFPSLLLAC